MYMYFKNVFKAGFIDPIYFNTQLVKTNWVTSKCKSQFLESILHPGPSKGGRGRDTCPRHNIKGAQNFASNVNE